MRNARRTTAALVMLSLAAMLLSGCASQDSELEAALAPPHLTSGASVMQEAQLQFREGNYGRSVDLFAQIVETDPANSEAWLGLAASYDQIRRFDLADKAYQQLVQRVGENSVVLNNIGYSHFLRGDFDAARAKLEAAHGLSPENEIITSNIELLNRKLVSMGAQPVIL